MVEKKLALKLANPSKELRINGDKRGSGQSISNPETPPVLLQYCTVRQSSSTHTYKYTCIQKCVTVRVLRKLSVGNAEAGESHCNLVGVLETLLACL
jgi:hypothetical protein